jgi:hypothetical protein
MTKAAKPPQNKWTVHRKGTSKYNNKSSVYNGYTYDSNMEAKYAVKLDLLIKAKEVKEYERQHKLSLYVDGKLICNYYVDFVVTLPCGKIEYHEVKGFETDVWKLKWKLAQALYGAEKFVLITK